LKTDRTTTKEAVPTKVPTTEIHEIRLTALSFLRLEKYRLPMYHEKFTE
jgi:hypothetical protein